MWLLRWTSQSGTVPPRSLRRSHTAGRSKPLPTSSGVYRPSRVCIELGTSAEIIDKLNKEINLGLPDPKLKARFAAPRWLPSRNADRNRRERLADPAEQSRRGIFPPASRCRRNRGSICTPVVWSIGAMPVAFEVTGRDICGPRTPPKGAARKPRSSRQGETTMLRIQFVGMTAALIASALAATAQAQQPAPPPFATTKVDGTDNVYIFRFGGHQSMFIVTPEGVIATDPIGAAAAGGQGLHRGNPEGHQGADQIRDLQPQPLRSHRRRQAVQGRWARFRRAQERQGAHRRS